MRKMKKLDEFLAELRRWQVRITVFWGHIYLTDGDIRARKEYGNMLAEHKHMAADLVIRLAKDAVEERAAIREADGLPSDLHSAALCGIKVHF